MRIETLEPINPNSNPFHYDSYHMGVMAGNIHVMYASHTDNKYLIIVNSRTGERHRLILEEGEELDKATRIANTMNTIRPSTRGSLIL